jgi:hypothetical protein
MARARGRIEAPCWSTNADRIKTASGGSGDDPDTGTAWSNIDGLWFCAQDVGAYRLVALFRRA